METKNVRCDVCNWRGTNTQCSNTADECFDFGKKEESIIEETLFCPVCGSDQLIEIK